MATVYLSLGSNLGDREANLAAAIAGLTAAGIVPDAVSRIYETAHVGRSPEPVPPYLNCVVRAHTNASPLTMLELTQQVERDGSGAHADRWVPRTIDVDILLYGSLVLETPDLVVPHPRMKRRAFVLRPLHDIEPGLELPTGEMVADLLEAPEVVRQDVRLWRPTAAGPDNT